MKADINFLIQQKQILEKIFTTEWLKDFQNADHPAFKRWHICSKIINDNGKIRIPEEETLLPELSSMILDSYVWIALTEGDPNQLKLGDLDLIGNENVRKKIQGTIWDKEKFSDLMVELYVGAWNKSEGKTIIPLEEEGFPDLKLIENGNTIFIECKNIRTDNKNKILQRIKKANRQIKNTGINQKGVLILDVSNIVGINRVENDNLSDKHNRLANIIQESLSGEKNSSIVYCIMTWDDYMVITNPTIKTAVFFRRRMKKINHKNNETEEFPIVFNGYTTMLSINLHPREYPAKNLQFSDIYLKVFQVQFPIDTTLLVKTLESYDKSESFALDSSLVLDFYLSSVFEDEKPYRIIMCTEKKDDTIILHWAFKIQNDLSRYIHYMSPLQIIEKLANKFGLNFAIGNINTNFIFMHRIQVSSSDMTKIVEVNNPRNHEFIATMMIKLQNIAEEKYLDCSMVFFIDSIRYKNWIN